MLSARRRSRVQRSLILLGFCLALYYVVVYRRLTQQIAELDQPLTQLWQELQSASPQTNAFGGDYVSRILDLRNEVNRSGTALNQLLEVVRERLQFDPATAARLEESFRLIDFGNERQTRIEELTRLAQERKVALQPSVASGFPEYSVDERQPPVLLWPHLAVAHHAVRSALQCGLDQVVGLQTLPARIHTASTNAPEILVELPIRLEVLGSATAANRFLEMLPLAEAELQTRGVANPPKGKPGLFLQRILMRKESREQLEGVRLELTTSGFALMKRDRLE